MPEATYDNVQPLVANQSQQGSSVQVTFRCPHTGLEASARGSVKRSRGAGAVAERALKQGLWNSLRRSVMRSISSALGGGIAGSVARQVANEQMRDQSRNAAVTREELQEAVVDAFRQVQGRFQWDAEKGAWVGTRSDETPFGQLLAKHPVKERYDQGLLARGLVEVASADGQISEEESAFLSQFLPPELGSVQELALRERLSPAELSEASAGVKESLLMLLWAMALSDEELAGAESVRLGELAQGLGVAEARQGELRSYAQHFVFEQALAAAYPGGTRDASAHAEAMAMAPRLGLDAATAETLDVRFRKRLGIV